MEAFFGQFVLAFVPIFVAVDMLGNLPVFIALTRGIPPEGRRRAIHQSILTALVVVVGFILIGRWFFGVLGITVPDFMVAGGALLFVIATAELVRGEPLVRPVEGTFGVVPLGTPLLAGPALLTAALILTAQHGMVVTLLAIVANLVLAGAVFYSARGITRVLGEAGSLALSKVTSLFLAAYGVMMIRRGLLEIYTSLR